jgi:hypothetical protein
MWGQPPSAVPGRRPVVFDLALDLEVARVGRTLLSDALDFGFDFAFDFDFEL